MATKLIKQTVRKNGRLRQPLGVRSAILYIAAFAIIGGSIILISRASTPTAAVEAEQGTIAGSAVIADDASASGGRAVTFGSSSSSTANFVAGINDHPIWLRSAQDTAFSLIDQANVEALRIDMPWDVIEPQDNQYDTMRLGLIDAYVNRAVAANIKILMIVTDSPSWATGSADRHAPPTSNDTYCDYLEFLMRRYGNKVEAYEIWNEPNGSWAWLNPDPVRYASLLKAAYTRAKSVDASRVVLAPSLSGPDQGTFLDRFYAQDTKNYFDAFSMHGYWWNLSSSVVPYYDAAVPDRSIFGAFNTRILPIMRKYGDENKRVWWTETGIATAGSITNETDQVNKIDEAFRYWYSGVIPTMDRLYWYMMFDGIGTGSEANFGIVNLTGTSSTLPSASDFVPKPAYSNYQQAAAGP